MVRKMVYEGNMPQEEGVGGATEGHERRCPSSFGFNDIGQIALRGLGLALGGVCVCVSYMTVVWRSVDWSIPSGAANKGTEEQQNTIKLN